MEKKKDSFFNNLKSIVLYLKIWSPIILWWPINASPPRKTLFPILLEVCIAVPISIITLSPNWTLESINAFGWTRDINSNPLIVAPVGISLEKNPFHIFLCRLPQFGRYGKNHPRFGKERCRPYRNRVAVQWPIGGRTHHSRKLYSGP